MITKKNLLSYSVFQEQSILHNDNKNGTSPNVEGMSDETTVKLINDAIKSTKRGRGRPRLTFKNTVSIIDTEESGRNNYRTRRAYMKRLMTEEAKEVCIDCSVCRRLHKNIK